ncbi:MAG: TetR/AcrR family transcriptional regulator [Myxococcota bacterium]
MVRPREFDEAEVADRALLCFWKQGFQATAISELVEATGIQRQSLYNTFLDKRGLFLRALARYHQRVGEGLEVLAGPSAGLRELQAYLQGVIEMQRGLGVGACLMVQTAFSPAHEDPEIRQAVEQSADRVRQRLQEVLRAELTRKALRPEVDPAAAAAYLYAVLNGASALVRTGAPDQASAAIELAIHSLSAQPRSTPPRARSRSTRRGTRGAR